MDILANRSPLCLSPNDQWQAIRVDRVSCSERWKAAQRWKDEETETQNKETSTYFWPYGGFSFSYPYYPTQFYSLAFLLLSELYVYSLLLGFTFCFTLFFSVLFSVIIYFYLYFLSLSLFFFLRHVSARSVLLNLSALKAVISTIGSHPSNMKHNPITDRFSLMNPVMWHNQIEEDSLQTYLSGAHQTACF